MISLVSLLVAAALVSQQCGFEANAQIDDSKVGMDNSLQPNVVAPPRRPRRLRKFVHIRSRPAEEVKRVAGERTELECVAMGYPSPSIYWMRNGETVEDPSEDVNEILPAASEGIGEVTSKLVITGSDAGAGVDEYACVAEAGAKRDSATTTVYSVHTDDEEEGLLAVQKLFLPANPIITYSYNSLFQDIGSTVLLPCRVHSQSETQVFWEDRNERLVYSNSRMRILPSGDLLINGLRWSDMGNFTCIAKNLYGKDVAVTFVYPTKH